MGNFEAFQEKILFQAVICVMKFLSALKFSGDYKSCLNDKHVVYCYLNTGNFPSKDGKVETHKFDQSKTQSVFPNG